MSVNIVNQTDASLAPIAGATIYADEPIGAILPFGGSTVPNGFLLCNGAAVSRTTYAALFAVIGTSFGAGDGSTTFNIPDLRGEFLRGAGTNSHSGQGSGGSVGTHQNATLAPAFYNAGSGTTLVLPGKDTTWNNPDSQTTQTTGYRTLTSAAGGTTNVPLQYSTRPTNTSVNFIIKATTISLPSDFEDAVDEKIDDALERKYVVAAGTYASGLLLEKSGHVVCAEFDGLSAAAIIEGTIPEGYRPVRNVLTMGVIVADGKSYSCWVWFFTNGTIAGAYAPENASPVEFTSARTSWSVHGSASWIVP